MTRSDLIREIGEMGCRSQRVQNDIAGFLNRAQRSIAQRRNWTWMHSRQTATILAGTTSIALSTRFKELAPEKSPVTYTAPNASYPVPVHVKSRAELEAMTPGAISAVTNANGYWSPYYVFIEQNDGGTWTLNTPAGYTHATDAAYTLSCFLYPADLALGTDSNGMTTDADLIEALIAKTKALAYFSEDTTDPRGMAAQAQYEAHLARAATEDARRRLAGRRLHW